MTRDAGTIITELHELTQDMVKRLEDPDYLVECVDKRQKLMDEFDAYEKANPANVDKEKLKVLVGDIIVMDRKINASLEKHKRDTKGRLIDIKRQQQETDAKATAPAGSFMKQSK